MAKRSTAGSIDEYIAGFPASTRAALEELRRLIRAAAPSAIEAFRDELRPYETAKGSVRFPLDRATRSTCV